MRERTEFVQLQIVRAHLGPPRPLLHRSLTAFRPHIYNPSQFRIYRLNSYFRVLVVAYDVAFNRLFCVTWDGVTLREVFEWEHQRFMF